MKDVCRLIDAIQGKRLRPYVMLSLLMACVISVDFLLQMLTTINIMETYQTILISWRTYFIIVIGFFCLFIAHVRFQKHFLKSGGMSRIQILPIAKHSYLLGQWLFCFATGCLLMLGIYVGLGFIYLLQVNMLSVQPNGFVYFIMNNDALVNVLLPIGLPHVFTLFCCLSLLAMCFTVLLLAMQNGSVMFKAIFLLIAIVVLGLLFMQMIGSYLTNDLILYSLSGYLLVWCGLLYMWMLRLFASGKMGG